MKRYFLLFLFILCTARGFAALSANTVWEVETTGNDNNAGAFVFGSSGTDYSYGAGQQVISWLATSGTYSNNLNCTNASPSVCSSSSRNFVAADVGNCINFTGGTNVSLGRHCIVSVTLNNATMEANIMTGGGAADGTGYMGGALATWGGLGAALLQGVPGMAAYIRKGSSVYSVAGGTTNTSGNSLTATVTAGAITIIGYNSTRGDLDVATPTTTNAPTIQASVSVASLAANAATGIAGWEFRNLILDGNSTTTSSCVNFSASTPVLVLLNVLIKKCPAGGVYSGGSIVFENLRLTAIGGSRLNALIASGYILGRRVEIDNCTFTGAMIAGLSGTSVSEALLHDSNTGSTGYGFQIGNGILEISRSVCVNIGGPCIFNNSTARGGAPVRGVIAEKGANWAGGSNGILMYFASSNVAADIYQSAWSNSGGVAISGQGSAASAHSTINLTNYTGQGSAFTNPAGGDFSLNGTTGTQFESLCFNYGAGTTRSCPDAGVAQHQVGQYGFIE